MSPELFFTVLLAKEDNAGQLRYVFCTSTIIEGVNTSAKNVVLFDGKKASNFIDFFDYSNIKGSPPACRWTRGIGNRPDYLSSFCFLSY